MLRKEHKKWMKLRRGVERTNVKAVRKEQKRTEKKMGSEDLSKGNGSGPCPLLSSLFARPSPGMIDEMAGSQQKSDCQDNSRRWASLAGVDSWT
jgi:hypothetical protein